jgi:hypothetical protein
MPPLVGSLILGAGIIVLYVYYITLMTYILRVDVVLNAIGLFFTGLEMLLTIFVVIKVQSAAQNF